MQKKIQYLNSIFSYYVYGNGEQAVFCFHGYASVGYRFEVLEPYLGKDFTLISVELPFHSDTRWNEHRMFYANDLHQVLTLISKQENLQKDIWLLGYSLGGRIVLDYFSHKPDHVQKIILLAPDGLHKIFWYWLIAETHFGNFLLRVLNRSSAWAVSLIKFFYRIKAINGSIYVLAKEFLTDKEERKLLVKRWITLRKMHPNLKKVGAKLKKHNVHVYTMFGEHDKVIDPENINYLAAVAPENVHGFTINGGHILLREPHAREISKLFYLD